MLTYRVNEIFPGLEGEGHAVGTPCVRVRLQGCSVKTCKLRAVCDQLSAIPQRGGGEMTLDEIVAQVLAEDAGRAMPFKWTAISGGEPTDQHIEPLIWALQEQGKAVRVETSGMVRRLEGPIDYVRVSPKELAPCEIRQDWGLELSVVYTGAEDLEAWERFGNFAMRTLQPRDDGHGGSNLAECIRICLERPMWQFSFQAHKAWGVR